MESTRRKVRRQASGKSRRGVASKMAISDDDAGTRYYDKVYKPNKRSQARTIGSISSKTKRRGCEISTTGTRKKPQIRRNTVKNFFDTNSSDKPLSSIFRRKKTSIRRKDTDGNLENQRTGSRRKRKRIKENREQDETVRLQRRTKYLIIKMKLEQNMIDAYSGEGWKGQSREKIKPVRELQRAKKQILKCKLGIRDAIHQLHLLGSKGCIEQSALAPDGSVFHEHIICAKCKLREAFPDNDIILCDGTCDCAFHQKCLDPPLATENIPPDDQGWLCKFCECKLEIIEAVNAHLGTHFSTSSNWQDVFKEAAIENEENASLNPEDDWPSDESDDDDYDPERNEMSCSISGTGVKDDMADQASSSSSFLWTCDEEANLQSRSLLENDGCPEGGFYQSKHRGKNSDKNSLSKMIDNKSSDGSTDLEISHRRQRRDVDYRKLHDEMFGKDLVENEQVSEDEDWGPSRRRRRLNESNTAGTLVTLFGDDDEGSDAKPAKSKKKLRRVPDEKRTLFRIPPDAVKVLRKVFAETELPPKDVKENLSKQLGIASEKISKWFKNTRYMALKIRREGGKKQLQTYSSDNESNAEAGSNHTTDLAASKAKASPLSSDDEEAKLTKLSGNGRTRKNTKSFTISPTKKKRCNRTAGARPTSINEVNPSSFKKKPTTILKREPVTEDDIVPKYEQLSSTKTELLYFAEMERLCNLQAKLEEMKKVLVGIQKGKSIMTKETKHAEQLVYVPVAEVRVKR
ncbi:hypothetical protein MKW94_022456 [Papaver nudicaule]|uniref:Pathogenesis-related homeodomain protein n=1 Tax=Papaver nudicaule TaxID=74823 RepID=A0AA42B1W9_PAPNU|nr:hypothetical protein [Papaver nudicaule]